jgi:hypothetical protein
LPRKQDFAIDRLAAFGFVFSLCSSGILALLFLGYLVSVLLLPLLGSWLKAATRLSFHGAIRIAALTIFVVGFHFDLLAS